jgi:hypothetical protein
MCCSYCFNSYEIVMCTSKIVTNPSVLTTSLASFPNSTPLHRASNPHASPRPPRSRNGIPIPIRLQRTPSILRAAFRIPILNGHGVHIVLCRKDGEKVQKRRREESQEIHESSTYLFRTRHVYLGRTVVEH